MAITRNLPIKDIGSLTNKGANGDRKIGLLIARADGNTTEKFFREETEPTRYANQLSDSNLVYGGDNPVSTDDIFC